MDAAESKSLAQQLREAAGEELYELVATRVEELDPIALRQLFRNPHLQRQVLELLLAERRLLAFHEVRKELARHPQTPEIQALRLVAGLFWRDLLELSADMRARPRLRRAAERHLVDRIPGLGAGEKVSIARRAGPLLVSQLRHDTEPRVIAALLDNPRLTEGGLMPLVTSDTARPEILALVARHPKWGARYAVRLSLARNRRTPVQTALTILPLLKKFDLKGIEQDRRLNMAVRKRAAVLLGRTPP
jgi:hypothetical protein